MEELFMKKYEEILQLFSITSPKGYTKEEMEKVELEVGKIPGALKLFYLKYGKSEELLHLQDQFILPNQYQALIDEEYIIFFDENQGVCQAGIKKADANQPNPPVYVRMDSEEWLLSADKVSDFLVAMFGYQASICLEYSPEEFYSREQRAERMCLHIHSATAARVEYPAAQLRYKFDAPSACCGVFDCCLELDNKGFPPCFSAWM